MKAQQIYERALALIDSITSQNQLSIASSDNEEYRLRSTYLIDMIQKELLDASDLFSSFEIVRSPSPNLLNNGFEMTEYVGQDVNFESTEQAKAYYFEVDGDCTVYIEDFTTTWNTLATINCVVTEGYKAYNGVLTPTLNSTRTRIRVTGPYYLRIANRALYKYPYAPGKVPVFAPWIKVELPSEVKSIVQVIKEDNNDYTKDVAYKLESDNLKQCLYIGYSTTGRIRVEYKPIPTEITVLTQDLQIDDKTASIMPLKLAELLIAAERDDVLAERFRKAYRELKAESYSKQPATFQQIVDVYNISGV